MFFKIVDTKTFLKTFKIMKELMVLLTGLWGKALEEKWVYNYVSKRNFTKSEKCINVINDKFGWSSLVVRRSCCSRTPYEYEPRTREHVNDYELQSTNLGHVRMSLWKCETTNGYKLISERTRTYWDPSRDKTLLKLFIHSNLEHELQNKNKPIWSVNVSKEAFAEMRDDPTQSRGL